MRSPGEDDPAAGALTGELAQTTDAIALEIGVLLTEATTCASTCR